MIYTGDLVLESGGFNGLDLFGDQKQKRKRKLGRDHWKC
jgi:hypothetical protein